MELLCNFKLNHETFIAEAAIIDTEMAADVRDEAESNVDAFEAAAEEWNNVTEITPQFGTRDNDAADQGDEAVSVSALVTVDMVTQHLSSHQDMEQYLEQIRPSGGSRRRGVRRWLCCLTTPPSLPPHLRQTVRLVQATALIAFSNEEPLHLAMLRTIYRQLTSTTLDCPRSVDHIIIVTPCHIIACQVWVSLGSDWVPRCRPQHRPERSGSVGAGAGCLPGHHP